MNGIEDDAEAARLQILNAADDALVRGRAAIGESCRPSAKSGSGPTRPASGPSIASWPRPRSNPSSRKRALDIGRGRVNLAGRRVGRIAEPGDDERDRLAFGMRGLQLVDRIGIIGLGRRPARNSN